MKNNLISIFVIGSMQEPKTKLKRYNDYDLRIVVKNMNESTYKTIVDFNENIKQKIKLNLNIFLFAMRINSGSCKYPEQVIRMQKLL